MTAFRPSWHETIFNARWRGAVCCLIAVVAWAAVAGSLLCAEAEPVSQLFLHGAYDQTISAATQGMLDAPDRAEWPVLLIRALGQVGKYKEAREVAAKAVVRFPLDLHVRIVTYEAFRNAGATSDARTQMLEMERLARTREWAYRSAADRVALGRIALWIG